MVLVTHRSLAALASSATAAARRHSSTRLASRMFAFASASSVSSTVSHFTTTESRRRLSTFGSSTTLRFYATDTTTAAPTTCWSCTASLTPKDPSAPPPTTHCPSCQTILPVRPHEQGGPNFFEVLGLPADTGFDVDTAALKQAFLVKSKEVHPDGYKGKGELEYGLAQEQSSMLNRAHETLKSPLSRAQYLLSLASIQVHETDSVSDQDLLMEILEAREALEEAETEEDVSNLQDEHRERERETIAKLGEAFRAGDLARAKELCTELRYWRKVDDAVGSKLHPVD